METFLYIYRAFNNLKFKKKNSFTKRFIVSTPPFSCISFNWSPVAFSFVVAFCSHVRDVSASSSAGRCSPIQSWSYCRSFADRQSACSRLQYVDGCLALNLCSIGNWKKKKKFLVKKFVNEREMQKNLKTKKQTYPIAPRNCTDIAWWAVVQ